MIQIGNFKIDSESRAFIIAELSANHSQNKQIAIRTIRAAKTAGADAIKLQTYTPDTLTIDCNNEYFQIQHGTLWDGRTLYDLYKEAYTPWEWHKELFDVAREVGLICFSTPFDKSAVDFLEELATPAYKIASFEIQDTPLIEYAASKGKPMIISTGIATLDDIMLAVESCKKVGNEQIVLLKCTSSYPAPIELANISTISDMRRTFDCPVGLSDHTIGNVVPVVATALGAKVIEKHFILDKSHGGPDSGFSLDPLEFSSMVDAVRNAEKALGSISYDLPDVVQKNRKFARSLFVVKDVKAGDVIDGENVRIIRPGFGMHPRHYKTIMNKRFAANVKRGTPLAADMIQE